MSTKNTLIALAAGAAVGTLATLLFAPASGKETRSKLMKQGRKLKSVVKDLEAKGREMAGNAKEAAKEAAKDAAKAAVVNGAAKAATKA
ncbi:MAG: YtxH domain-containing protein [Flavobacteriales bacterium]|nr:YtxH domain-containing protein [Flavobacteriales bacterium]